MAPKAKQKPKSSTQRLTTPRFSKPILIIFALIFATTGGYAIYRSFAFNGTLPGDNNNDGQVNLTDLTNLLANWNTNNAATDFNNDGTVNGVDLSILLSHYGQTAASSSVNIAGIGAWRISGNDTNDPAGHTEQTLQLGRYSSVVYNAYEVANGELTPAQIHADSPGTKVMMYASSVDVDTTCTTLAETQTSCATGIGAYDINNGHSNWVLRNSGGTILTNGGYSWYEVGDIGNPAFQQQWATNVINRAKSLGFDGVSIDDILGSYGYTGSVPATYPNQAAWQNAMVSFLQYVYPALHAQGLYVAAEVNGTDDAGGVDNNDGSYDAVWWGRVAPYLDALFCEYFEQNPNNWAQSYDNTHLDWFDNWDGWLNLIDVAQNAGKAFWGLNYATANHDTATDQRLMVYGKASFMLKWNGNRYGAYFFQKGRDAPSLTDNWDPRWTMDIGMPTNTMYSVGTGAYRRDYSLGTVVVNPTPNTQTINLGATYTDALGNSMSSVTLGATSAAILHK